jgi:uncharacterized protein involved in exopolysaccharide biosynthesis
LTWLFSQKDFAMQQTTDTSTNKTLDPISGVSFMGLLKALWQGKITVILCTLVAGGMSIFYSLSLPNQYQSSVLLSPVNDDSNAKLSGISQGLASFTGTSLNGGGVDAIDVGLETIQSRQFLLDFIKRYNIQVPLMAGQKLDNRTGQLLLDTDIYDAIESRWKNEENSAPSHALTLDAFRNRMAVNTDIETGLITISFTFISPNLAQQWLKSLIKEINDNQRNKDVDKANKKIEYLQSQVSQTQVTEMRALLFELIKEEYKIKLLARTNQEYFLETIDPPVVAEFKSSPKRALICLVGAFLGSFLGFLIIYSRREYPRLREQYRMIE